MLEVVERILAALIILAFVSLLIVLASLWYVDKNKATGSSATGTTTSQSRKDPPQPRRRVAAREKTTRTDVTPAPCVDRDCYEVSPPPPRYEPDRYDPPAERPCGPRYGSPDPCECESRWRPYWARYRYADGCER